MTAHVYVHTMYYEQVRQSAGSWLNISFRVSFAESVDLPMPAGFVDKMT